MATSETRELLGSLVATFGDASRIRTLLAPDAQWWISPTGRHPGESDSWS
jgi:hypothetical protein